MSDNLLTLRPWYVRGVTSKKGRTIVIAIDFGTSSVKRNKTAIEILVDKILLLTGTQDKVCYSLIWYSHSCIYRTFNTFKCLFKSNNSKQNDVQCCKKRPKERMPHVSFTENDIYAAFYSLFISLSPGKVKHICNMTTWSWKQLWKHLGNCSLYYRSLKFSLKLFNAVWNSFLQDFFIRSIFLVHKHSIEFFNKRGLLIYYKWILKLISHIFSPHLF